MSPYVALAFLRPFFLRLLAGLGLLALGAGSGCSSVPETVLVSSRSCRFQLHGYVAEVREETRGGDKSPGLYLSLTALDAARSPYAIAGFRQGSVFRISLRETRRSTAGLSTVWGTAAGPAWRAPALTVTEGRALTAQEQGRAETLLEQATTLAYAAGRWRDSREHRAGPIALRLP